MKTSGVDFVLLKFLIFHGVYSGDLFQILLSGAMNFDFAFLNLLCQENLPLNIMLELFFGYKIFHFFTHLVSVKVAKLPMLQLETGQHIIRQNLSSKVNNFIFKYILEFLLLFFLVLFLVQYFVLLKCFIKIQYFETISLLFWHRSVCQCCFVAAIIGI